MRKKIPVYPNLANVPSLGHRTPPEWKRVHRVAFIVLKSHRAEIINADQQVLTASQPE